ncbi:MAG: hypothetical protein II856_05070 [Bacteroidales bacterium]|nr:hypothetical protein [Bacteroidales bacterium]
MKIGLIRETKVPEDNRVALTPKHLAELQRSFPQDDFVVQASETRAYSDEAYRNAGVQVAENVDDCDILFGIKEADIRTLIPNKHYFFFGHIAKMQAYNRPLLQTLMAKHITFSDYEYLVDDDNRRVCAFGWWAGVVGTYYTLRGYGLRHHLYELPKPDKHFTLEKLTQALKSVELPHIKLLVTGNGRVSHGAQYLLEALDATRLTEEQFLADMPVSRLSFCAVDANHLVARNDDGAFSWEHFTQNPTAYHSDFMRWARQADVLVCAHFWAPEAPVYLSQENLADPALRIRFIGDITCDIQGSIQSTLRASTHAEPYYDYNPATGQEEPAFSNDSNISVMAVDTCPNALALDTSAYFGDMLMQHVLTPLLKREHSNIIQRATILENGALTPHFAYLQSFAEEK